MTDRPTVDVTPRAATRIAGFASEAAIGPARGLRLDVIGGAASGFAYDLFFDAIEPDDVVLETGAIRLLVRADCVQYVAGTTIDWVETDNGAGFTIRNPNEPT